MLGKRFISVAVTAGAFLVGPSLGVAAERMQVAELAARIGDGHVEFRGFAKTMRGFENFVWRFTPDGRVKSEYAIGRLVLGGMGEVSGQGSGTWRREAGQICVQWDAFNRLLDGCYDVLGGSGSTVYLTGTQVIEGQLHGRGGPSYATPRHGHDHDASCDCAEREHSPSPRPR